MVKRVVSIKDNSNTEPKTDKDFTNGKMAQHTREGGKLIRFTELECILGLMDVFTQVSGTKERCME